MKRAKPEPPALRFLASKRPLIIGHRGYAERAPENTAPSFELALEAAPDLVEFDYQHSKDGVPVVIHDDTLDRTTDSRVKWRQKRVGVADKTAAEIGELDAGSWFDAKFAGTKVPLLAEALEFIRGRGGAALIEHKSGDAGTCVDLLRARNLINQVVVISFDWRFLREFHEIEPRQVLGALGVPTRLCNGRKPFKFTRSLSAKWLDRLAQTGARIVVWNPQVSTSAIRRAHERNLKVWIYTVDDPRLAACLLEKGVDGLITNRISAIREAVVKKA